MSKELDYIADLERENRILKELLYCTKRSCNNCGKVNCENFQRQRIDCCGLWVSYKDYIAELENKIADIKANCDLAIEGRDVKIKELEEENNRLLDVINNQDVKIADLEKENAELKSEKGCETCTKFEEVKLTKAKELIEDMYDKIPASHSDYYKDVMERVRQFIKEIEK